MEINSNKYKEKENKCKEIYNEHMETQNDYKIKV